LHYHRVTFQITQNQTVLYYQLSCLKQITQNLTKQHMISLKLQITNSCYYLCQGGCVFCCCLSVYLLATLCKNFQTHLHEILRECWQWASEQMIKFCWRSGSCIRMQIWVRHALAEVCNVPVLLVKITNGWTCNAGQINSSII